MIRILGAFLIVIGCGGFGMMLASTYRYEEKTMRHFLMILDTIECELQYHLTPLPELCRIVATNNLGILREFFFALAEELDKQISPNVELCMIVAAHKVKKMPELLKKGIALLGKSLGYFDLDGQLKGIATVRRECEQILSSYSKNLDVRIRCYQTLSVCAGAALAILFI